MAGRFITGCVLGCVLLASGLVAAQRQADVDLQRAIRTETVDGNLRAAIEQYNAIAANYGSSERGIAGQALLRMAEAYQKLGDVQARAVYERIAREFSDQKDMVERARMYLDTSRGGPVLARGDRTVWAGHGADGFGTISPDGRFLTYTDWENGASLAMRDLTLGANYRLTTGGSTEFSAISHDGRQVAYEWFPETPAAPRPSELRVGTLTSTGMSGSRVLFKNEDVRVAPFDWSPDGRWIAVSASRPGGVNQIGLVDTRDGALRVLKSVDWKEPTKIFFSPDGKYIAYDLQASDEGNDQHVFVLAVDGTLEAPVVAHASQNAIMGWSPDGQQVLFSSDRSGSVGLWAVKVANGKAVGDPTLLKADTASFWSLGLTASGALYVWKYASPVYVQASPIDLASGRLSSTTPLFQRFITSRGRPAWSADGKQLAFQSCAPLGGGPCTLWIQSMETGQLRQVAPGLGYFGFMSWSPDGRQILTQGRITPRRAVGPIRIDVLTGEATLVTPAFPANGAQWSADSQHVYYRRGAVVVERDLASAAEREVVRIPTAGAGRSVLSPDARMVAYLARGQADTQQILVLPVSGGTPRSVFEVGAPYSIDAKFQWTADGRSLAIVKGHEDSTRSELWVVDVTSGGSRKIEVALDRWKVGDGYAIDQAGRQIAFVANAGQPGLEIRALENFLPAR